MADAEHGPLKSVEGPCSRRSTSNAALVLGLLAAPLVVEAKSAAATPEVRYLSPFSSATGVIRIDAFLQALREQGYIDGTNVVVVPRFANGDYRQLSALAAELVTLKVDVIVALTTPVVRAAERATPTIPIVFTLVSDPVHLGFVASLARPGGNLTGHTDITADLVQKRLALLKEVVPQLTRVGFVEGWAFVGPFACSGTRRRSSGPSNVNASPPGGFWAVAPTAAERCCCSAPAWPSSASSAQKSRA
jgi:hypothetical protein